MPKAAILKYGLAPSRPHSLSFFYNTPIEFSLDISQPCICSIPSFYSHSFQFSLLPPHGLSGRMIVEALRSSLPSGQRVQAHLYGLLLLLPSRSQRLWAKLFNFLQPRRRLCGKFRIQVYPQSEALTLRLYQPLNGVMLQHGHQRVLVKGILYKGDSRQAALGLRQQRHLAGLVSRYRQLDCPQQPILSPAFGAPHHLLAHKVQVLRSLQLWLLSPQVHGRPPAIHRRRLLGHQQ